MQSALQCKDIARLASQSVSLQRTEVKLAKEKFLIIVRPRSSLMSAGLARCLLLHEWSSQESSVILVGLLNRTGV